MVSIVITSVDSYSNTVLLYHVETMIPLCQKSVNPFLVPFARSSASKTSSIGAPAGTIGNTFFFVEVDPDINERRFSALNCPHGW